MKRLITICLLILFAVNVYPVQATITGQALGTAAPPSTLGPYTMTGFPADPQAEWEYVSSVASPLGGTVDFSRQPLHGIVPSSWGSWSHGYTGDVYIRNDGWSWVTLTLPSDTGAFYLYAEPSPYDFYQITSTAQDGTSVSQMVTGNSGACGYGFWATGGDLISTISVNYYVSSGFAVGEFGIAKVPEPTTICLLGLGALSLLRRKRGA